MRWPRSRLYISYSTMLARSSMRYGVPCKFSSPIGSDLFRASAKVRFIRVLLPLLSGHPPFRPVTPNFRHRLVVWLCCQASISLPSPTPPLEPPPPIQGSKGCDRAVFSTLIRLITGHAFIGSYPARFHPGHPVSCPAERPFGL
ncbi:hypothetical protein BGW80DRAFT_373309 [Lactifluus volemus]|nr:hypothetical protein BGW80DRAFT_373309 [Lactifluus volemus]